MLTTAGLPQPCTAPLTSCSLGAWLESVQGEGFTCSLHLSPICKAEGGASHTEEPYRWRSLTHGPRFCSGVQSKSPSPGAAWLGTRVTWETSEEQAWAELQAGDKEHWSPEGKRQRSCLPGPHLFTGAYHAHPQWSGSSSSKPWLENSDTSLVGWW